MTAMHSTIPEKVGLPYWMDRVLQEHAKVGADLAADAVHDLRISLRRCILIADVMRDLDPGADWKGMRKAAKHIFNRLGSLRDSQVLAEWIEKLRAPGDASSDPLVQSLKDRSERERSAARDAIREFDRKQWRAWTAKLASHYRHVASDRPACESIVYETWDAVRDLHRCAQKSGSRVAYHRLRVGLKKFRYAVENFLPPLYVEWAPDLKFLQDVLGQAHDLNVLGQAIAQQKGLMDETARGEWIKKLREEGSARIEQYRRKMAGKSSPLWTWREGLPGERKLRAAGLARLGQWSYFLTPDASRTRRVARLSLQLHDGLANCGLAGRGSDFDERTILQAAALLQEVGHSHEGKPHHKEAYRMIRRISPPAGWTRKDLELVALIARFHRRALPRPDHKVLRAYDFPKRHSLILLASILRFANAFRAKPYRNVRRLEVEDVSGVIVVRAEGFSDQDPLESKLSEARRLLEFACQRSVHILAPGSRMMSPRIVRPATRIDAA
ncbi:MAG: CHAD domain-containing protein [Acidobacteriia bacterium]|nr:CHAD domain-containing protein [Terriglobia bacterium]